ncbi:MAG: DUF302 domain-containing protein [Planctomycetota bacterium]|jgi:uncharacterized protein (DUF302 family)
MRTASLALVFWCTVLLFAGCASQDSREGSGRERMCRELKSPFGLSETVEAIVKKAKEIGWVVNGIKSLEKNIKKHGGPEVLPVRLIELCHPQYSGKLMLKDDERYISVLMPCVIAVYLRSDSKTYVSHMVVENLAPMMGGQVAEVMGGPVAKDQARILEALGGRSAEEKKGP